MNRWAHFLRRLGPRLLLAAPILLGASVALARGGGGHSYSGGSHSSGGGHSYSGGGGGGGGDGGIGILLQLVFTYPKVGIPVVILVIALYVLSQRATRTGPGFSTSDDGALQETASAQVWKRGVASPHWLEALRQDDPDFSEPLFLDFVAALVARSVATFRTPRAAEVDRYLAGPGVLSPFSPGGWQNVVVGSTQLVSVSPAEDGWRAAVQVALGASNAYGGGWWRTTWLFARKRGVRSKGPGEITRLACPACGAGSERREDGACQYCGQKPPPGEAAWAVQRVSVVAREARPPVALGGYAEEVGTNLRTIRSPSLAANLASLPQSLPGFEREEAIARFRYVFLQLQKAWSDRDLATLRALTTDAVFSTWRYWIEAYRAAGLRNRLEQVQVARIEPAKVTLDKYYAAVTVRIFASMVDQTVNDGGRVVDGKPAPRAFTEYWTFVRTRSASSPEGVACSGCGANLPAGQTGQCPYCGSLVGAPAFDWILSRIDQDEDYTGT